MNLAPFQPADLFAFEAQGPQKPYVEWMTPEIGEMAAGYFSFTGRDAQGRIVGCAGLAPVDDVLVAWAVFSRLLEANARAVLKAVKLGLDLHRGSAIVAHVHADHAKAARFAEALCFKLVETRSDLHPSGALMHVYVREGL